MNGSSYGELTTYPNKVYFQCDEGFVLKGSSLRVCMANGSWSGNESSCEGVFDTLNNVFAMIAIVTISNNITTIPDVSL